ncbi:similar to Saccharomyces cerevisiae YJR075W HOC1 Alpha-1,6-mannosyltransferase involved in cell wall mannan biosynthesis [Maudiozyma barnettii]|uniref:Similar to Saccharomyces cerevisiae YJR075W HOC1 Alpha-1,6-mannosyltransferase involved in cell wall mannan biosynthesis n=1 Tax=Maudiozyma barnettii TaxID=61262 RepID=A0A8H2VFS3_9SACH|nr:alpha-1,6-mannosyltransferase [Kazachstania barnettii]CAB4254786.1 similar to Saccharomyces cerevisiae YJR075W HOC1 Alpha-1,6-mannosyltransferase involved in cell wall mannan biosynthesis [Kazachstania barnettii]CAD1782935.1 similar to Saccharomyces cerevisiae YJR075W HOC1 Alpha-1,6-mannosyltransferase involved in cell wall mannan biosynthesis [Kazachstania barnettii]
MAKSRSFWKVKRLVWFIVPTIVLVLLVVRFINNSKATDLQTILQNLPTEISQSINNANNKQQKDADIMSRLEELTEQLLAKQEEQSKEFEKERKALEKKINDLKPVPDDLTLREKLAYNFPYDPKTRFPAFIWQMWNGKMDDIEVLLSKQQWGDKNPGFVHEVFNDELMDAIVRHFYSRIPEVLEAYTVMPSRILKIDFFKYLILLARGGVYVDMDTFPVQPIPNWIPEAMEPSELGMIVGIEHDAPLNTDWKKYFVRRLQIGNWVIQAKPGHPTLREIVSQITELTLHRKEENSLRLNFRNDLTVMGWTGSGAWTDVIFTYFNDYIKSGLRSKTTWRDFHDIRRPKLLSDILVLPQFSFASPQTIENDDPRKKYYFVVHAATRFWKGAPKVEQ